MDFSFQFCVVVPLCAMGFLELVFAFWSGLLIWCVVMVHRIHDEVKRQVFKDSTPLPDLFNR